MGPKRNKLGFQPSTSFDEIVPEIEDEIVEKYAQQLGDDDTDLHLDRLPQHLNKLVKFRNHHQHIASSWKMLIQESGESPANIELYQLTLPGLKNVKSSLNLDNDPQTKVPLNDGFLIDMLGCCQHNAKKRLINFAFNKQGATIMIKDFAFILGKLGELDDV